VTESGYQETEDTRTLVGRDAPVPHALWLVEVASGDVRELSFDALPGIATDPLASLRKAAGKDPLKCNRALRVEADADFDGPAIHWTADSRHAAILLRAIDNKDRWIATVTPGAGSKLQSRHRLTDPGWINWGFNDFGWMPKPVGAAEAANTLWYLSEESGYSHLYTVPAGGGAPRALTSGKWEVSQPRLAADGSRFLFVCNQARPIDYEVCAVDSGGGTVRELTALDGVEGFSISPDGGTLLVRHSSAWMPPQLSVVAAGGGAARQLTDTRTPAFRALDWIGPETALVPLKHGAGTIWGKYFGPANPEPGRKYPLVMYVHGAGDLQSAELHWPDYFREQMFHT